MSAKDRNQDLISRPTSSHCVFFSCFSSKPSSVPSPASCSTSTGTRPTSSMARLEAFLHCTAGVHDKTLSCLPCAWHCCRDAAEARVAANSLDRYLTVEGLARKPSCSPTVQKQRTGELQLFCPVPNTLCFHLLWYRQLVVAADLPDLESPQPSAQELRAILRLRILSTSPPPIPPLTALLLHSRRHRERPEKISATWRYAGGKHSAW